MLPSAPSKHPLTRIVLSSEAARKRAATSAARNLCTRLSLPFLPTHEKENVIPDDHKGRIGPMQHPAIWTHSIYLQDRSLIESDTAGMGGERPDVLLLRLVPHAYDESHAAARCRFGLSHPPLLACNLEGMAGGHTRVGQRHRAHRGRRCERSYAAQHAESALSSRGCHGTSSGHLCIVFSVY